MEKKKNEMNFMRSEMSRKQRMACCNEVCGTVLRGGVRARVALAACCGGKACVQGWHLCCVLRGGVRARVTLVLRVEGRRACKGDTCVACCGWRRACKDDTCAACL